MRSISKNSTNRYSSDDEGGARSFVGFGAIDGEIIISMKTHPSFNKIRELNRSRLQYTIERNILCKKLDLAWEELLYYDEMKPSESLSGRRSEDTRNGEFPWSMCVRKARLVEEDVRVADSTCWVE
ncbi:hypothetical protein RND71_005685 [Anisodus tanguticus]|uniref:Uncharacterized protein n=1 Tax=Anisodus tanguticus TaxID=243964 RepID=A0AAE1VLQ9_9SOLA|nr:hypothetical protein RND71_005685 [Anisodus tanguticus]